MTAIAKSPSISPRWTSTNPLMTSLKNLKRSRAFGLSSGTLRQLSLFSLLLAIFLSTIHYYRFVFLSTFVYPSWNSNYPSIPIVVSRPIIAHDEFFHKGPSIDEINEFFRFDVELYMHRFSGNASNCSNFRLYPLWNHREVVNVNDPMGDLLVDDSTNDNKKLIFIHTSRTAGSTIRAILHGYASQRPEPTKLLSVKLCFDLNVHFIQDRWKNGRYSRTNAAGMDCTWTLYETESSLSSFHSDSTNLSFANNRWKPIHTYNRANVGPSYSLSSVFLQNMSVDIIAGQVPLGCDAYWYSQPANPSDGSMVSELRPQRVDAQYVIFFRHPLHQFVSEFMFRKAGGKGNLTNDTLSPDEAIQMIRETVEKATSADTDDRLFWEPLSSDAFITPTQMDWVERSGTLWTSARRVNLTLSNLLRHKIMIGIVERMPESLALLQYLLDPQQQLSAVFQFFASKEKVAQLANVGTLNRTNEIVTRIQSDANLLSMVEEFIQYEIQIYSLAVQIHEMQYRWLQEYG